MFFVWGSSTKLQPAADGVSACTNCNGRTVIARQYRVFHAFWFPLVSTSGRFFEMCGACGQQRPVEAPSPVRPRPFLHRFGFALPLAILLVPVLLGIASSSSEGGSERAELRELERSAKRGQAYGATAEAQGLADAARGVVLRAPTDKDRSDGAVAVTIVDGTPRRVVAVVRLPQLKKWDDIVRREFVQELDASIRLKLAASDELYIGLKGAALYGAIGFSTGDTPVTVEVSKSVDAMRLARVLSPAVAKTDQGVRATATP